MNRLQSLVFHSLGVALACSMLTSPAAMAQTSVFTKPVRFIIPYPPGGPTDLTGRTYAERLEKLIGQPVIIENKPGAQGIPAVQQLLLQPADGHVMYFGTLSTQVVFPAVSAYRKQPLPFHPIKDLQPVSILGGTPIVVAASIKSGIGSFKELVDRAKANPGALNYGSDGIGSITHLAGEIFDQATGVKTMHIPYKGTANFSTALLAGDIEFAFSGILGMTNMHKSGRVKVLAIAGPKRAEMLPEVPTMAELGYPTVDLTSWFAVYMKHGTPKPFVDAMSQAIQKASLDPDLGKKLSAVGLELGMSNTPEQFTARQDGEYRTWSKLIEKAAIKFEE